MFSNAKEFSRRFGADLFLIGATILLLIALRIYNPNSIEAEPNKAEAEIVYVEATGLNDSVLKLIEESPFAFIRRAEVEGFVNYEVYVKRPIDNLKAETEALSMQIFEIWAQYTEGLGIRVSVLNYGNQELVDIVAENGVTTFKRK